MGGIANGIAYHGGFIPYVATFLTFSDYMRGSVRLSALSGLHVDRRLDARLGRARRGRPDPPAGRALRGAAGDPEPVVRPAGRRQRDARRLGAGRRAAATDRWRWPSPARSSRPGRHGRARARGRARAAATSCARRPAASPQLILIGTGSELQLAFAAAETLEGDGIATRVVSLPCWETFDAQDQALSRLGAATGRPQAGQRRDRRLAGLGALGRRRGRDHRARPLRRLGAGRHDLRAVRLHRRPRRGRRPARWSATACTAASRPSTAATSAATHPTMGAGDSGVDRTGGSDPGHS